MNSLIILADLGRVKAYRITDDDLDPNTSPAFEDVVDVDLKNHHSKVSDRVTDKAGRFGYGAGSNGLSENHHEQEEAETQQLHAVAKIINEAASDSSEIYFAAPKEIIDDLKESIDSQVRQRIRKDLALNLVKAPKLELLERFGIG